MTYANYMKEYRARNRDRINEQQRSRYAKVKPVKAIEVKPTIELPKPSVPVVPTRRSYGKCAYCYNTDTEPILMQGVHYPVCLKHRAKALSVG